MKARWHIPFVLIIAALLFLTACQGDTALRFSNKTDCGTAVISLQNMNTGSIQEYSVEPGQEIQIDVVQSVSYHYEVTYPNPPANMSCEAKSVNTIPQNGQTLHISLTSATATPNP